MSREGFRFVHATCLCLDEPLSGTGPLSGTNRELAEEATFRAWNGIVEHCLSAQVDFLLLTGNSFNSRLHSLRARIALEKGFEKLAAHQISVYVVPGVLDPVSSWKRDFRLPANVTLIADEHQEPLAIMKEKRVVATLFVVASADADASRWGDAGPAAFHAHRAPFRIGVLPAGTPIGWEDGRPVEIDDGSRSSAAMSLMKTAIDERVELLALGAGVPRTERIGQSVVHDPGCAQATSKEVTGSRGCSVVDVAADGEIRIDRIAVAPVRWEEIRLELDQHSGWSDVVERMALAVMESFSVDDDERLWIINWKVSGEGEIFESLAEPESERELWELLEAELQGEGDVRRVHRLERVTHREPEIARDESSTGLLAEFHALLDESSDDIVSQVRRELLASELLQHPDSEMIREIVQTIGQRTLVRRAKSMAGHWLE